MSGQLSTRLLARSPAASHARSKPAAVPPVVHRVLRSPGEALPDSVRRHMEAGFHHDFSRVRVHTDTQAAASARAVNARAYTVGHHVAFGAGEYEPRSVRGQRLLAHELTHVLQQDGALGREASHAAPGSDAEVLEIGRPGETAEHEADRLAGHALYRAWQGPRAQLPPPRSLAPLDRRRLQRVPSWAGEWTTRHYNNLVVGGQTVGVDIEIDFDPNDKVEATGIGLVQTAMSQSGGVAPFRNPLLDPEWAARSVAAGPNLGLGIDRRTGNVNPLYHGNAPPAASPRDLGATTIAAGARLGWRHVDSTGTVDKQSARLGDTPQLTVANNSTQQFETAALAVAGQQRGTYYGSVSWGWRRDGAGNFTRLPFQIRSNDVPSGLFLTAAGMWNASATAAGQARMPLNLTGGRWVNVAASAVVQDPTRAAATELFRLAVGDRVEVTATGTREPFNSGAAKWWKVTVVSVPNAGRVGWTVSTNLSTTRPP